ncbi:MAG: EamA family transporter [Gammaproteobacteria bacterium]
MGTREALKQVELWIPVTILAAFLQNLRSMLQKQATGNLSVNGASYTRFCFALPFVWLYLGWLGSRGSLAAVHWPFAGYCLVGGVAQILGTASLLASFTHDNFSVGTAYSKTEVAQTALFGLILLGETLSATALAGVAVSFLGVVALSSRGRLGSLLRGNRALALGLLSGAGFAVAAVSYRAAALSLPEGDFLVRAGTTLAATVTLQTVIMGSYLVAREPGELTKVLRSWRTSVWVGLLGGAASACWFTAMTLVNAGLVRALGQVELLFTFVAAVWFFRERVTVREIIGAVLIVLGIWLLLV